MGNGDARHEAAALAVTVGAGARPIVYMRIQAMMTPEWQARFDADFAIVLRRALARV